MKTNCDYCGSVINDSDEKCPNCGAVNTHFRKVAPAQPKTIEELKLWYQEKKLPSEDVTRFYIGKDVKSAKAYGIYKDQDKNTFVVYKNKADGTRAVRYDGADEAYAVNEIFQKLREVMVAQKNHNVTLPNGNTGSKRKKNSSPLWKVLKLLGIVYLIGFASAAIFGVSSCMHRNSYFKEHPDYNHYYNYDGDYYYNLDGDYYLYDNDSEDWSFYGEAPFDEDNYEKYIQDGSYSDYDVSDFEKTDYYDNWYDDFYQSSSGGGGGDYNSNDNDWDSGWDDSGWDSDYGSDWDSDW